MKNTKSEIHVDRKLLVSLLALCDSTAGLDMAQTVRFDFYGDMFALTALGNTTVSINEIPCVDFTGGSFSFLLNGRDLLELISRSKEEMVVFELYLETRLDPLSEEEEDIVSAVKIHLGKSKSKVSSYTIDYRNYDFAYSLIPLESCKVNVSRILSTLSHAIGFVRSSQNVQISYKDGYLSFVTIGDTSLFIDRMPASGGGEFSVVIEAKSLGKIQSFLKGIELSDDAQVEAYLFDNYLGFYSDTNKSRIGIHQVDDSYMPKFDHILNRFDGSGNIIDLELPSKEIESAFNGASIFNKVCTLQVCDGKLYITSDPSEIGDYSSTVELGFDATNYSVKLNSNQMKQVFSKLGDFASIVINVKENEDTSAGIIARVNDKDSDYPRYYISGYSE